MASAPSEPRRGRPSTSARSPADVVISARTSFAGVTDARRLEALHATGLLGASPDAAFDRITRLTTRLLRVPVALLTLVDADRQLLLGVDGPWPGARETPLTHSFCQHVVGRGAPVVVEDARNVAVLRESAAATDLNVVAYAGLPLTTPDGHVVGALCAIADGPRQWSQEDLDALADLAAVATSEVERRTLATHRAGGGDEDPVTGLGNRRAWDREVPRELARARRFGHPLILAVLHLDRFGRYADRRGRAAADDLLHATARAWQPNLREVDVLVRLDGAQFGLLMPVTPLDPAFDVVERLRALPSALTCSAGVAMLREGESAEELLARADAALRLVKRSGRNASALAS